MKNRNISIDVFRLIGAILVLMIHANPFEQGNANLNLLFKILSRMAVPYFSIVCGYFFYKRYYNNLTDYVHYIKKLILPYLILSVPYTVFYIIVNRNVSISVFDIFLNFIYKGSYFHLWFYPSIVISLTVIYFMIKWKMRIFLSVFVVGLYIFFTLGDSWYGLVNSNGVWNQILHSDAYINIRQTALTFIYASLGIWMAEIGKEKLKKLQEKIGRKIILMLMLLVAEVFFTVAIGVNRSPTFSFFLLPTVLYLFAFVITDPFKTVKSIKRIKFKQLANFIYFFHPIVITIVGVCISEATNIFIITLIILLVIGSFVVKINHKFIEILFT